MSTFESAYLIEDSTEATPVLVVIVVPSVIAETKSATVSFFELPESSASTNAILSAVWSIAPESKPFRSVPPPPPPPPLAEIVIVSAVLSAAIVTLEPATKVT